MFKFTITAIIALTAANAATAGQPSHQDARIAEFCGADHVNEVSQPEDGRLSENGYEIVSMDVVLEPRDPRVVPGFVDAPYLCTMPGADAKAVKYLFVPSSEWGDHFAAP